LLAVAEYVSEQYPYANKGVFATSFGGFITLLCADQLGNIPLVLRSPAVTMPKVLLENVLKVSAEDFRIKETILCGFERPIHLPYTFYKNLSAQETLTSKRMIVPMLVIHGQCDDVVPLSDVQAFADTQNNIALQILPGADHRFKKPGEMETILNLTERFLCEVFPNFRLENG
jgi:alpha/beta superfamily hydrolase